MFGDTVPGMTVDVDDVLPPARRRFPFWLKVAIAPAVILLGAPAFAIGYLADPEMGPDPREQARRACFDAVQGRLAGGSTPRFFEVSEVSAGDIAVVAGGEPKAGAEDFFTVTGKFETSNARGVTAPSSFICAAKRTSEGWSAEATVF